MHKASTMQHQSRSCGSHHIGTCPHSYTLPSQFPNDYLSITDIRTSMNTPTVIAEDSNLIPFSFPSSLNDDGNTLCEYLILFIYQDTFCILRKPYPNLQDFQDNIL